MTLHDEIADNPPIEASPLVDEIPPSRWPTVIGVISIIYAIIGLSCAGVQGIWIGAQDVIPEMFRGGVSMPAGARIALGAMLLPVFILGIMLLTGGIGLVRRKRSSVPLLKKWVIGRIVMLVIGMVVYVLTAPTQIEIQKQSHAFMTRMMEENNQPLPPPLPSDDAIWRGLLLQAGIASAAIAIYPFVLGMFLSRKKIDVEVAEWR